MTAVFEVAAEKLSDIYDRYVGYHFDLLGMLSALYAWLGAICFKVNFSKCLGNSKDDGS